MTGQFNIPAVSILYRQFHVGDAASDYLLSITSDTPGDGTLYNSFTYLSLRTYHSGRKFSTYDRDNEGRVGSCATINRAGWWIIGLVTN